MRANTVLRILMPFIFTFGIQQVELRHLNDDTYTAAVVEYEADKDTDGLTAVEILWRNAENYRNITHEAAASGADIVVFPEYGLTSLGAFPPQLQLIGPVGENPCTASNSSSSSEVIRYVSCAARSAKVYVVIDILELSLTSGIHLYNTALAFDRDGTIVAKYHKTNLASGEAAFLEEPKVPEIVSFKTDFGVEFGMMICFDVLFEQPGKSLLERGVRHFVFPTAWIDQLPYLMAIQSQTFWASSASSVLLASGYNKPSKGYIGSGIFMPSGQPLNYVYDPSSGTQILYAKVPKNPNSSAPEQPSRFHKPKSPISPYADRYYLRENLENFTLSPPLDLTTTEQTLKICDQELCCSLSYSYSSGVQKNGTVMHRLVAFNGIRRFSKPVTKTMRQQVCSVVRCLNETMDSCNVNEPGTGQKPMSFSRFELVAKGLNRLELFRPGLTTLDVNLDLIPIDLFVREDSEDGTRVSISSDALHNYEVQTVAIYHRAA